jgi:serine/threonine-protein kinase
MVSSRGELRRPFRLGSGGSGPETAESRKLVAERLVAFARLNLFAFGAMYLGGALNSALFAPELFWAIHGHPAKIANLGVVALAGLIAWLVKAKGDSDALVLACDLALPFGTTLAAALALQSAPVGYGLALVPLLIMVPVICFRAALVPTAPARTAVVVGLATLPVLAGIYHSVVKHPWLPISPGAIAGGVAMWSAVMTVATYFVSREIYGLRREVAEARRLGQYTLVELLGEGGMGAVYRAKHALLRRPTAVKLLLAERAGPHNIERFEREVQLTSSLTHPNTVAVYDYGRALDGTFYYAMEYVDGMSLEQLVERFGPQPVGRVVRILLQATDALAEAHDLELIHRDIKPANILICERGRSSDVVKLVDFGLVKQLGDGEHPELSRAGTLAGTPLYLAPESITTPEAVDRRIDLYALGAVGYFLVTGTPPFQGRNVVEICGHHLHTPPTPPSERLGGALPEAFERLLLRCLSKDPNQRPQSASELEALLRDCAVPEWTLDQARDWWRTHAPAAARAT